MNTTARTAHADQMHACRCDALDLCESCRVRKSEVVAARHQARVAAANAEREAARQSAVVVPTPRGSLLSRLVAARVSA